MSKQAGSSNVEGVSMSIHIYISFRIHVYILPKYSKEENEGKVRMDVFATSFHVPSHIPLKKIRRNHSSAYSLSAKKKKREKR